jgi:hypothetical protein
MSLPGVNVLTALSITYLDRLAANDVTRASIVIAKLSEVYPSCVPDLAAAIGRSPADLPAAIPNVWDGTTREVVRVTLPTPPGNATAAALGQQITSAQVVSQIPPLARRYLEFIPASNPSRQFAARVAESDIGSLPAKLNGLIAAVLSAQAVARSIPGTTPSARFSSAVLQMFQAAPSQASDILRSAGRSVPGAASASAGSGSESSPIALPETRVTGQASGFQVPTWGWVVLGLGVLVGGGFFVYRRYYSPTPP